MISDEYPVFGDNYNMDDPDWCEPDDEDEDEEENQNA